MSYGRALVNTRFLRLSRELNDLWEIYELWNFYAPHIHEQIRDGALSTLPLRHIIPSNASPQLTSKKHTLGMIQRYRTTLNAENTLLQAVSTFEHFMNDVVEIVYHDYPAKLETDNKADSAERETKLLTMILESQDKDEILQRIIEERVRGIFYGNPVDVFIKDKARLQFGDYFKSNHRVALEKYAEITARRNIMAHNDGKVDRKYLREVAAPQFALGRIATVDDSYLRESLYILKGIGGCVARLIIQNIYKETVRGRCAATYNNFKASYP